VKSGVGSSSIVSLESRIANMTDGYLRGAVSQ